MTVRFVFLCHVVALLGVAGRAHAQDSIDCTRYRAAGLPCPPASATGRSTGGAARTTAALVTVLHASAPQSTSPASSQPHVGSTALAPGSAPASTPGRSPTGAPLAPAGAAIPNGGGAALPVSIAAPVPGVLAPVPAPVLTPKPPPATATTGLATTLSVVPAVPQAPAAPVLSPVALKVQPAVVTTASPLTPVPPPVLFMPGAATQSSTNSLVPLAQSPAPVRAAQPALTEPGQIVMYWAAASDADVALARLLQVYQLAPVSTDRLQHLGGVIAVFQLPSPQAAASMREQLRKEFPSAVIDFNTRYRPLLQPAPQPRMYLSQKIDLPPQVSAAQGALGIRIGIVDGPVAGTAALRAVKLMRKQFLAATDTAASAVHATAIATLIAGQDPASGFAGIAPQANLYSAEIMRTAGSEDLTNSAALVRALDWLLAEKVQVINLSLGGPGDLVMEQAFSKLTALSVVVVAAAGNGGPTAAPAYPAAYPGVIAVTATDAADKLYVHANRGSYVAVAAPGVDVWVPDGDGGRYVSGTSFSAAVVTAASALLLTQGPQHHARTMAQRLCRGAKDLGPSGNDPDFGCGLLQINASLQDDRS